MLLKCAQQHVTTCVANSIMPSVNVMCPPDLPQTQSRSMTQVCSSTWQARGVCTGLSACFDATQLDCIESMRGMSCWIRHYTQNRMFTALSSLSFDKLSQEESWNCCVNASALLQSTVSVATHQQLPLISVHLQYWIIYAILIAFTSCINHMAPPACFSE